LRLFWWDWRETLSIVIVSIEKTRVEFERAQRVEKRFHHDFDGAKDALGYFHPADVVDPLSSILERANVTIATFQKHINEFCEKERGPILERAGVPRAYKYRFLDPLLPPYIFMKSVSNGAQYIRVAR
jgi:hypothetical protein